MQSRMPSTLYTIVDTPLRAEGRRISEPPAAGPVLVCYSLDSCVPDFISYIYAKVMPHAVQSVALACLRAKRVKPCVLVGGEKTSGLVSAPAHGAPVQEVLGSVGR